MNNFLVTGNILEEKIYFALLLSKFLMKQKHSTLIFNLNPYLNHFFPQKNNIQYLKPKKFSLNENYFCSNDVDENKIDINLLFESLKNFKIDNVIFLVEKKNTELYLSISKLEKMKIFEFCKINEIEKSIEEDILNRAKPSNFIVSYNNCKTNFKEYLDLKRNYLEKIIDLNLNFNFSIENITLIPKKFYSLENLKLIKSILINV